MPLFRYEAIDSTGSIYHNIWTAPSLEEAKRQLRAQGIMVKSIALKSSATWKISGEQRISFFHQLGLLMKAGFPLYEALVALQDQYEKEPIQELLLSLSDQIHAGSNLADALSGYPDIFDSSMLAMVRAGERGATLPDVLERVSKVMGAQLRLKKQLITAMIYPALLATVSFLILLLMLLLVVPALEPLFEGSTPSSMLTVIVFAVSRGLRTYGWIILGLVVGISVLVSPMFKRWQREGYFQTFALKVPIVGNLILRSRLARFGFVMHALLESGVPLVEALEMSTSILSIGPLAPVMAKAIDRVLQGDLLSHALTDPHMPKILPRLIRLGESSGNLALSFAHLQEMMDEELQKDLERLTAVAQPVILVVMGTMVGLIMAAILIPLTDMGRFQGI